MVNNIFAGESSNTLLMIL